MANRHRICSAPSLSAFEPNLEEPEDDIERCPDCGHDLTDETECNVCEWTADDGEEAA